MSDLLEPLFGDAQVSACFGPTAVVEAMLAVEVALAQAQARIGMIPPNAAAAIQAAARAERFDLADLAARAATAGNLAIPLVARLTELVAAADPNAADFVHWGATSQDVIDTALVLELRRSLPLVVERLRQSTTTALAFADRHATTPIAGRTWLQQAVPTTFGLKACAWADGLIASRRRLEAALARASVVSLGGAAGNLAAFGEQGLVLADALAGELGLTAPAMPWHTNRGRLNEVASALGEVAGVLGKIGLDLALLAQTEVGEVSIAGPAGGSSAMPQKRNPVGPAVAIAIAGRAPSLVAILLGAMTQEHERGLGNWLAEWDTLPELVRNVGGSARAIADSLERLVVDEPRMEANLTGSLGLAFAEPLSVALWPSIGKRRAQALVGAACERARSSNRPLADIARSDAEVTKHLSTETLAKVFRPALDDRVARALIARVRATDA